MIHPFIEPPHKPASPFFASGPCTKFKGWSTDTLKGALLGRSHRSKDGLTRLEEMIRLTREVLDIPTTHHLALMPGSATGALECALWNFLGARPVCILSHDVFSQRWADDIINQLTLTKSDHRCAPHGQLPTLENIPASHDIVLNWNGSTSGVKFPHLNALEKDRDGLVIADLTSAAFTMPIPWQQIDAAAFSWQKGLGGEAAHGLLVISPKAIERLNTYRPPWPIPYLFKLRANTQFFEPVFQQKTLNTPSLLCVEDFVQALKWAQNLGGLKGLVQRSQENFSILDQWIQKRSWVQFMATDPNTRSSSTMVFQVTTPEITNLPIKDQWHFLADMTKLLSDRDVAFDILNHEAAPPSLRIWGGPTVESQDIAILLDWIDWAYHTVLSSRNFN